MNHLPYLRRGLLALSLGLATLPTFADDDCKAPMEHWQSRDAVRQMGAREGWHIQRLKIDDGCYEIRGTDAQGRDFKAKIDPETLKVLKLKLKQRDRERSKERDRDRDREHVAPPPPSAATAPAPAPVPLFTPGSAPRGQIE